MPRRTLDINWKDLPLGQVSDRSLAADLGCSVRTVQKVRWRLGIPAFDFKPDVKKYPRVKRDWSVADTLLGTMPDKDLGLLFDIPYGTVFNRRRNRNIPAFCGNNHKGINWDEIPLGAGTDSEIGKLYGLHTDTVRDARCARGIRAY